MRQQYHFRKKGDDTYIWDVRRLVKLSRNITIKEMIDHFVLMQNVDLSYPIIFCSKGRLMDGMHRVAKARYLGKTKIKVVQFQVDPEPDYINIDPDDLIYEDT